MQAAQDCQTLSRVQKDDFYQHVIAGLRAKKKTLHPKFFYDKKGSEYFDAICQLEEYYPYKTELTLLPKVAQSLGEMLDQRYALIEFGAGSLLKVQPILERVEGIQQFFPIDISGEHLRSACVELNATFPSLEVEPVEADFTQPVALPSTGGLQRLGFFPGSTIGNLTPEEAEKFLEHARETLGEDSYLLIGVDTKKSAVRLHRAYNDEHGVTAEFNKNILHRINQHFDANINVEGFEHYAFYNAAKGCIEMHLMCLADQSVDLDDVTVHFSAGETIHTESSYKYTPAEFSELSRVSGWQVHRYWLAQGNMFSVFLLHNKSAKT